MAEKWIQDERLKTLMAELKRLVHRLEEQLDVLERLLNERGNRQ